MFLLEKPVFQCHWFFEIFHEKTNICLLLDKTSRSVLLGQSSNSTAFAAKEHKNWRMKWGKLFCSPRSCRKTDCHMYQTR